MDTNTLQVIEKFGSKMDTYIQAAAEKAGMAVEYFWPIYVKQQYLEAIASLCVIAFFFSLAVGLITIGKGKRFIDGDPTLFGMRNIVGGIICLPLLMVIMAETSSIITGIMNPEYAAFKALLSQIK
jgi:hypothetical protein